MTAGRRSAAPPIPGTRSERAPSAQEHSFVEVRDADDDDSRFAGSLPGRERRRDAARERVDAAGPLAAGAGVPHVPRARHGAPPPRARGEAAHRACAHVRRRLGAAVRFDARALRVGRAHSRRARGLPGEGWWPNTTTASTTRPCRRSAPPIRSFWSRSTRRRTDGRCAARDRDAPSPCGASPSTVRPSMARPSTVRPSTAGQHMIRWRRVGCAPRSSVRRARSTAARRHDSLGALRCRDAAGDRR